MFCYRLLPDNQKRQHTIKHSIISSIDSRPKLIILEKNPRRFNRFCCLLQSVPYKSFLSFVQAAIPDILIDKINGLQEMGPFSKSYFEYVIVDITISLLNPISHAISIIA